MIELKRSQRGFFTRLEAFARDASDTGQVKAIVEGILQEVRTMGDEALIRYTERFDGFRATAKTLRVAPEELKAAESALAASDRRCIREAIASVREFHRHGLPSSWRGKNAHGATVGEQWYPIERVGIYIPAGSVPLVSTAVMTTTLAHLAGVGSIAVCTPAGKDGTVSPAMLAGLSLCGVSEVYRVGGAQAIGALAYGTKTIEPVDKIMGPGNAFVAEAQRQVFGEVGIDLLPGPSEAMAIADESAHPEWLAADLLSQAEHGSGRERLYYVFTSPSQARAVIKAAEARMPDLKHHEAIRHVWNTNTCFIQVADFTEAAEVANFIAPEHLELHTRPALYRQLTRSITTAGAILCGHHTPTVLGDFTAGPSHTLPTARTGRFFSGLKITDFMRRSSVVCYDAKSLGKAREVVDVFARLEDLDAHGASMEVRFKKEPGR